MQGVRVVDAMTVSPVTAAPAMTLHDVAILMDRYKIGSILVREGRDLIGIVTEADYVRRGVLEGCDPRSTPITSIMTADLITVSPGADLFDALLLMKDADIQHLPVVDDGVLVGFITMKDILKVQPQLLENALDMFRLREEERKPIRQGIMPLEELD